MIWIECISGNQIPSRTHDLLECSQTSLLVLDVVDQSNHVPNHPQKILQPIENTGLGH